MQKLNPILAFEKVWIIELLGSRGRSPHKKTNPPACLRLFAGPNQVEDFSFERPVFNAFAETFAQRILLNVKPFLGIVLAVAQAMMPAARLKPPLRPLVLQRELALPIGYPRLNRESQIVRRTETVKVIWH